MTLFDLNKHKTIVRQPTTVTEPDDELLDLTDSSMFDKESSSSEKRSISVSFSIVSTREYHMTLGDNPSVSVGPPVTIDWKHECEYSIRVDELEKLRDAAHGDDRKTMHELIIPRIKREKIIMGAGHSRAEIRKAEREISRINAARDKSLKTYAAWNWMKRLRVLNCLMGKR